MPSRVFVKHRRTDSSENTYAHGTFKGLTKTEENKLFIKLRGLRDEFAKKYPKSLYRAVTLSKFYHLKPLQFST